MAVHGMTVTVTVLKKGKQAYGVGSRIADSTIVGLSSTSGIPCSCAAATPASSASALEYV